VDTLSYKTVSANKATVSKQWVLIDAEDQVLGRLSSTVAKLLRGKFKTSYTPHVDCGDNVVIINAEKIRMTGRKLTQRQHVRHTGYPGGQRFATPKEILAKHPERLIEMAVKRMLPKTKLGSSIYGNLYVYEGSKHEQEAQQPQKINLNDIK